MTLRIAYVVHTFDMGGIERCVARLVNHLDRSQFEPVVICLDRNGDAAGWIESDEVPIIELHKRAGNDPRLIGRLSRVLRKNRIDLVHSHNWGTLLETVLARKWARTPRHVHAEHGMELNDLQVVNWRRTLRDQALKWGMRRVDAVVTVAQWVRDRLAQKCGLERGQIEIVPNGVEALTVANPRHERLRLRRMLGIPDSAMVAGSIGRLAPVKNFGMVIDAVEKLVRRQLDLHLILVGDGPELSFLKTRLENSSMAQRVHFVGWQTDTGPWLAAMDVYVNSSLSEAMSLSVLEAMGAGLSLAVTDVGENARLVDGEAPCGIVVPSGDAQSLANAMHRLLSHSELRDEYSRSARQRFSDNYRVTHMVKRYETLYAALGGSAEFSRSRACPRR